jgi:flagellar motility protein MotE (MotC chaperone)
VSKKVIILTAAGGLVSFAGAFAFAWLSRPSPADHPGEPGQQTVIADKPEPGVPQRPVGAIGTADGASGAVRRAMTEHQLKNLVQDVREKMQEYDERLQALATREQRLQLTQNVLKEDIEKLNNLRIEVASTIANLKSERDNLLKSRLEIDQMEQANLVTIAATYDKMDVTGASKILTNMCKTVDSSETGDAALVKAGGSYDDAVKILHYMTERTKAKLLAELATSEPALAAELCRRLKRIVEGK